MKARFSGLGVVENVKKWKETVRKEEELLAKSTWKGKLLLMYSWSELLSQWEAYMIINLFLISHFIKIIIFSLTFTFSPPFFFSAALSLSQTSLFLISTRILLPLCGFLVPENTRIYKNIKFNNNLKTKYSDKLIIVTPKWQLCNSLKRKMAEKKSEVTPKVELQKQQR